MVWCECEDGGEIWWGNGILDFGCGLSFGFGCSMEIDRLTSRSPLEFSMILKISSGNKDCELGGGVEDDPGWLVE